MRKTLPLLQLLQRILLRYVHKCTYVTVLSLSPLLVQYLQLTYTKQTAMQTDTVHVASMKMPCPSQACIKRMELLVYSSLLLYYKKGAVNEGDPTLQRLFHQKPIRITTNASSNALTASMKFIGFSLC